jgi:hypothetical protein
MVSLTAAKALLQRHLVPAGSLSTFAALLPMSVGVFACAINSIFCSRRYR